jgi:hypothetical protein
MSSSTRAATSAEVPQARLMPLRPCP